MTTDMVRNIDVAEHAMLFMEAENRLTYEILILLQPTSPIRNPAHIDQTIDLLWESQLDSVVSVIGKRKYPR